MMSPGERPGTASSLGKLRVVATVRWPVVGLVLSLLRRKLAGDAASVSPSAVTAALPLHHVDGQMWD